MKVIVVGVGKLGFEVAGRLLREGHDLVVVDSSEERLAAVSETLDVLPLHGNGASPALLRQAGAEKADLLIAVTGEDEVNMVVSQLGKTLGTRFCAARLRNWDYFHPRTPGFPPFGIDLVIHPEYLTAVEIMRLLEMPMANHVDHFAGGRVMLVGLRVKEGAAISRGPLREIETGDTLVAAIVRDGDMFIPDGSAKVKPGDVAFFFGKSGHFEDIRKLAGVPPRIIREVTLAGGGKFGYPLLRLLAANSPQKYRLKVIDADAARCRSLAEEFPKCMVIHGDVERPELLSEEQVGQCDAFIAATKKDPTNLLASMLAKELGAREVISIVTREDYTRLAEKAGADAVVVPRLIAAGRFIRISRSHPISAASWLEQGKAVVFELTVQTDSPAVGKRLRDFGPLPGALIGSVVRNGRAIIPDGNWVIRTGDRLVIVALSEAIVHIESLFRSRTSREGTLRTILGWIQHGNQFP